MRLLATLAGAVLFAAQVQADIVVPTEFDDATLSTSSGYNLSGYYVGGFGDWASGTDYDTGNPYPIEGSSIGAFVGYNYDMGSTVLGGELATWVYSNVQEICCDSYNYNSMIDLKGRYGYKLGDALLYVVAGASVANFNESSNQGFMFGYNVGAGADYSFGNYFVGAEYLYRDISSDDLSYAADMSSYAVRFGYQF